MNLNLSQTKEPKFFALAAFILIGINFGIMNTAWSQNKTLLTAGFSVSPGFGSAYLNDDVFKSYMDSVHSSQSARFMAGAHVWINYSLKKDLDMQIGLGYQDMGFARKQENLKVLDPTYPGLGVGIIQDKSSTSKGITYNYHFHYLQIPLLFNFYLNRSGDFKWVYSFSAGLATNILISQNIQADLSGFTIDSKKTMKLDSTGFDGRRVSTTLMIGAKFEFKSDKTKSYFIQPIFGFNPISASSNIQTNPWYVVVNAGVLFPLTKK